LPDFYFEELPETRPISLGATQGDYIKAVAWIDQSARIVVKVGGGARQARSVPGLLALEGGRDSAALRAALTQVGEHDDLSIIDVPVYSGPDELGGMGVYGRWNVGNGCDETQAMRHEIGM
jgi:hypothetical protein